MRLNYKSISVSISLIVLSLLAISPAHAAKEPLRVKASSQWQINYANDSCRLLRHFGKDEGRVSVIFDRFEPNDLFRITLIGKPVESKLERKELTIRFGPAEAEQKIKFVPGNLGKEKPALFLRESHNIAPESREEKRARKKAGLAGDYERPKIDPVRQAAVTYLSIGKPLRRPVILELGAMDKPLAALDKCANELLTHWGIDAAKHKSLKQRPTPKTSPGRWITSRDYPKKMLRNGQRGLVHFRLIIDEAGKPVSCHIQLSLRPKEFDDAVCAALIRNGKFHPAIDNDGAAIKSYWRNTVFFDIPG